MISAGHSEGRSRGGDKRRKAERQGKSTEQKWLVGCEQQGQRLQTKKQHRGFSRNKVGKIWKFDLGDRAPPYPQCWCPGFSCLWSTVVWRQMTLPVAYHQKANNSLTLRHRVCVIPTSSHQGGILSSHIITRRRVSPVKKIFLRKRDRAHIHVTFIRVYCSILLLIVVNLLLHLMYKLNFILGMYVQEKAQYPWFQESTGGFGMHPPQRGRTTV